MRRRINRTDLQRACTLQVGSWVTWRHDRTARGVITGVLVKPRIDLLQSQGHISTVDYCDDEYGVFEVTWMTHPRGNSQPTAWSGQFLVKSRTVMQQRSNCVS